MSPEQKTIERLERHAPTLSGIQKEALWKNIEVAVGTTTPVPTPFLFTFIHTKSMTPLILALVLVLGSTGTVLAANDARPGDLLYPIDRVTEAIEGSLLRGETKSNFTAALAQERVDELRSIINDDAKKDSDGRLSEEGKKHASEAAASALKMVDDIHLNNETRKALLERLRAEVRGVDTGINDDRLKFRDEEQDEDDEMEDEHSDDDTKSGGDRQDNRKESGRERGDDEESRSSDDSRVTDTRAALVPASTTTDSGWFQAGSGTGSGGGDDDEEMEDDDEGSRGESQETDVERGEREED